MEGSLAFIDQLGVEKAVLRHMETANAPHYLNNSAYIQTEYKTTPRTYLITFFATPEGTERFARAIDGPIPVDETPPPEKPGCFIATAAYGTGMEVQVLSEFRDHVLRRSYPGRIICNAYYCVSPRIAGAIRNSSILKMATRLFLSPIITAIRASNGLLNLRPWSD